MPKPDLKPFLEKHRRTIEPLNRESALAGWHHSTTGLAKWQKRSAALGRQRAKVFSNAAAFERLDAWRQSPPRDAVTARLLERTWLAFLRERRQPDLVRRIVDLEVELKGVYNNFRATLRGKSVADNDIARILGESGDLELRRDAWEASKQIGAAVHGKVRELARLRNANARAAGFPDHYRLALAAQEIDLPDLTRILDDLQRRTERPWTETKTEIDLALCRRFHVPIRDLPVPPPWFYADPFFQKVPRSPELDLDGVFSKSDLVALALDTYDGLGMEVRDILRRSSLFPQKGKSQHAFCTSIDRKKDIRILCNLAPDARWMETLLHELGHAVYDKYLDPKLPYLLRGPAHTLSTEAIALLMGRQVQSAEWLSRVRKLPAIEVKRLSALIARERRRALLIFARWALVMSRFERALYEDPEGDLDALWWKLVEEIQHVPKPEGRSAPDWAAKMHIACAPVYYHNYLLGDLMASQLEAAIRSQVAGKRLIGNRAAGAWLRKAVFRPGARWRWDEHLKRATGEGLNAKYWVQEVVGS